MDYRNFCSEATEISVTHTTEISVIHTTEIFVKSSAKAEESSFWAKIFQYCDFYDTEKVAVMKHFAPQKVLAIYLANAKFKIWQSII